MKSHVNGNGLQHCGHQDFAKDAGRAVLGGVWPCMDPWDSVRLRTASAFGTFQGIGGPGRSTKAVSSNPFVSAETLKACALIGLHLLGSRR